MQPVRLAQRHRLYGHLRRAAVHVPGEEVVRSKTPDECIANLCCELPYVHDSKMRLAPVLSPTAMRSKTPDECIAILCCDLPCVHDPKTLLAPVLSSTATREIVLCRSLELACAAVCSHIDQLLVHIREPFGWCCTGATVKAGPMPSSSTWHCGWQRCGQADLALLLAALRLLLV